MGGPYGLPGVCTSDNLFRLEVHREAVISGRLGHFDQFPLRVQ